VNELTHLDLFSGIGGFALAAHWNGVRTVGFCEREPYCKQLLSEQWPQVPICGDICEMDGKAFKGVWLVTGGFPCQPFSVAGKRLGASDDRALWPEMLRVIDQARPTWVLGENVPGIINMELDRVLSDLENIGYASRAFTVPACSVGADHVRNRVWVVANSMQGERPMGRDCSGMRRERKQVALDKTRKEEVESAFLGTFDGVPAPMDRLRGLGNAIVPQVAAEFIRLMIKSESL